VAALHGEHFKVAELLLEHGANVDVRGEWEFTLLHFASWPRRVGRVDIVRWLLNHGADVNAQSIDSWFPLFLAVGNGHVEICQLLQLHNADLSVRTIDGETLLHRAASPAHDRHHDQLNIMRLLLDQGADVNARDHGGRTPLHYSSFQAGKEGVSDNTKGTVEGARLLLKYGADIDARDNAGKTPLQFALDHNYHEMAEFLLGIGAS